MNYTDTYYKIIKQQNNTLTSEQKEKILKFIRLLSAPQEVLEAFTGGYCNYFAKALTIAFSDLNPIIIKFIQIEDTDNLKEVYNQMKQGWSLYHAACEIGGCLFDITGEITNNLVGLDINETTIIPLYKTSDRLRLMMDLYCSNIDEFKSKYPLKENSHIWLVKQYFN